MAGVQGGIAILIFTEGRVPSSEDTVTFTDLLLVGTLNVLTLSSEMPSGGAARYDSVLLIKRPAALTGR